MNMIKLNSSSGNKVIYINPKYIVTIEGDTTGSVIRLKEKVVYIKETPEEIYDLLQRK